MFKKDKNIKLSEEEYIYLDSVMLFMRHASQVQPKLDDILKPIAFGLMDRFYRDRPLPVGEVHQLPEESNLPNLTSLLGGRLK